jgi:hypothetical protein
VKIKSHSESHIVELVDGSRWQVFPGDIDITLHWKPETDLELIDIDDDVSSHALVSSEDEGRVRVLPEGERWPAHDVRAKLRSTRRRERQKDE